MTVDLVGKESPSEEDLELKGKNGEKDALI